MNVGIGIGLARRQPPAPAPRPRSPESKARSPVLKPSVPGPCAGLRSPGVPVVAGGASPGLRGAPSLPPQQHQQLHQQPLLAQPLPGTQPASIKRGSSSTVEEIKRIDANREQRRRAAEEVRRVRQEEAASLSAQCGGAAPDIDFLRMIRDFRQQCPMAAPFQPVDPGDPDGICVCVRKRPIQQHELASRELDCVTACNPFAIVHERKFKVDGITKCLESHQFEFDRVFDEECSTEDVYRTVARPLVPWVIEKGGRATIFAYGQTGSGKTHTMTGLQRQLADQIFEQLRRKAGEQLEVSISFFEIYGGRPYDLLNNRQRLETLEDARNEVQIAGLVERAATSPDSMLQCIELGNSLRTTHATAINRDSSRSHAVCAVFLRYSNTAQAAGLGPAGSLHAKITLVDLAGSERAADSKSSIRQRRVEGAQINKSLLALKECIRAMGDPREGHVPFRASKLTLVLRDAFVSRCPSRTVMIACISPGMASADHSVNTLRYSDRLKDHPRASRQAVDRSIDDVAVDDRAGRRVPSAAPHVRDARSPEPPGRISRFRSPSPVAKMDVPGAILRSRAAGSPVEAPKDDLGDYDSEDEEEDFDDERPTAVAAWEEASYQSAPLAEPAPRPAAVPSSGPRQPLPARRGRQPILRPREVGVPTRPDALGSRGQHVDAAAGRERPGGGNEGVPPLQLREAQQRSRLGARGRSPDAADWAPANDLHQQDNRYLQQSLTAEVFERNATQGSGGVVDVGVEDLTDLAHMEVLDEVRQWEDRIVSQHMVALQEDARLLTAESELLSQVQQAASYDIDWYVCEVDKVVRRKMEVYAGFLEELEAFKAQLRREESLSRSCRRGRRGAGSAGDTLSRSQLDVAPPQASPRVVVKEPGMADALHQRTPRTPRTAGYTSPMQDHHDRQ